MDQSTCPHNGGTNERRGFTACHLCDKAMEPPTFAVMPSEEDAQAMADSPVWHDGGDSVQ